MIAPKAGPWATKTRQPSGVLRLKYSDLPSVVSSVSPARRATEVVYLDDLGINLKPARALGFATIKVVDPGAALAELSSLVGFPLDGAE